MSIEALGSVRATIPNPSYYRARYYDPSAGRFLSEDPIRFDAGINFYAYVGNNSATLTDPFGLQHMPGGPYHAPGSIRCTDGDLCPELLRKLGEWARMIASHALWDWQHGTNRHERPGPRGGLLK